MKKFGKLLLCFVPLLISLAIQVGVGMVCSIVMTVLYVAKNGVTDPAAIQNFAYELASNKDYLQMMIIAIHTISLVGFGLFYRFGMKKKPVSPAKVFSPVSIPALILMFMGMEAFTSCAMIGINEIAPDIMESYAELIESVGLGDQTILITIATLVLAPLGEEILFRGITLKLAERFTKKFWIINLIQALAFGICHMNLVQGTYAFVLGLLLGYAYKRYHSLYAPMIGHLVYNFTGTYLVALLFGTEEEVPTWRSILVFVVAIIFLVGGFLLTRKEKKAEAREKEYDLELASIYATTEPVNTVPPVM